MPNSMCFWNKVDKAGDTMTGNLNLGLNSLILSDGAFGGRIRGNPSLVNNIQFRNIADNGFATLANAAIYLNGDLYLYANSILGGDATDGFRLKKTTGGGQKLFIRNYGDTSDGFVKFAGGQMTDNLAVDAGKLVDGRDISAMVRAKILTGTYTGDGTDDRNINIGVDLTAKSNVFVFVKVNAAGTGREGYARIEYGQGDLSMLLGTGADIADRIQAFNATGFQVGGTQNENGLVYRYVVIYEEP